MVTITWSENGTGGSVRYLEANVAGGGLLSCGTALWPVELGGLKSYYVQATFGWVERHYGCVGKRGTITEGALTPKHFWRNG